MKLISMQSNLTWRLRPSILAISTMLAVGGLSQAAHAQEQPADESAEQASAETEGEDNTIVVTGFRASLASAIAAKREADNIADVIKADDIASFPDANLAESIQRVPGVSITRDAGEGRNITVRGLGGEFVRTLLNGVEAYSATTGSTLGAVAGINRTRGFDYSTFASELFNSITVHKSQSAEMDEGSLAATVNLETAKPFDQPGFRGAVSAQAAYYDNNQSISPRVAGLISDTFGDFGALFSFAYSERKAQEDGYSDTSQSDYSDALNGFCGVAVDIPEQAGSQVINTPIPYVNTLSGTGNRPANQCFSGRPSDPTAYARINVPNVFLPRNPGLGRFILDQKRLGLTGALQWRPSDSTEVTLDAVYSIFDQNRLDYALSLASNNRNVNGATAARPLFAGRVDTQIMDVNVDENGQVDYMQLNNVDIKHIQEKTKTRTKTHQIGLNIDHDFSDSIRGNVLLGHAGSNYDQPWTVFVSYDAFNKNNYIWDSRDDVRRPLIDYGYDVTDPSNVTFTNAGTGLTPDIRIVQAQVENTLATAAGNLEFDISSALTFKAGAMYKRYNFRAEQTQRLYPNNGTDLTRFNFARFATDFPNLGALSTTIDDFGGQLGLPDGSVTGWVVPDAQAFIDELGVLCNCANEYGDWTLAINSALGNNRSVREEDKAAYGQLDFDFDVLGGHRLRGNVGLRYVKTDVAATGFLSLTSSVTVKNSYEDWLPAANLAFDIAPDLIARAAFAKVMARPGLQSLNPGGTVNTTFGAQTASIGNPFLKPYRARNYDLSLEWYPATGTFLGVAFFYKDVLSTIQNLAAREPYGETGLPLELLSPPLTADSEFLVTRSRNTEGGWIKGFEVNLQQPFNFLPGPLSNFGVLLNYTYVKSKVLYYLSSGVTATTTYDQFSNVSPHSVNGTLYYEDDRFSARVSVAYRDEYLIALPFKAELPDGFGSYATTNVDAALSYKITPNLKLTADALNLTNQEGDQWSGKVRRSQRVYSTTGRQFFVGASFSF